MNGEWSHGGGKLITLTPDECETENDIALVICPKFEYFFPCSLYTAWATRVASCSDLNYDDNVFIVPEDRLYMLPTKGIGHRSEIVHIPLPTQSPIHVETLSDSPKIFRLSNFISSFEANELIFYGKSLFDDALSQQRLKKEGIKNEVLLDEDYHRSGDTYYNVHSELVTNIKKRAFDLLGLFPFDEKMIEGFQVSDVIPYFYRGLLLFLFPCRSFVIEKVKQPQLIWIGLSHHRFVLLLLLRFF
jgi:hypothetical protein